jgi:hypothetical protein
MSEPGAALQQTAVALAAALLLGACARPSDPSMGPALLALSQQPRVQILHHPPARVFTLENAAPTAMASLAAVRPVPVVLEGRQLADELGVRDPVARLPEPIVASLHRRLGGLDVVVIEFGGDDDPALLERTLGPATVLSVRTTQWGLAGNRPKYEARARLIDLSRSRIVWEARCSHVADEDRLAPSMQSLSAAGGALLKLKLGEAADACAAELVEQLVP